MIVKCFLCGCTLEQFGGPYDNDPVLHVKCPNCGEYQIPMCLSGPLEVQGYFKEQQYIMASGRVFETSYYKQIPKLLSEADFDPSEEITTPRKLYLLAKYIFTEERKNEEWNPEQDIPCRPVSCYARDSEEWYKLLDRLQSLYVVDIDETSDPPTDRNRRRMIWSIKMTFKGKIAFEKGIDSPEKFEEVFMNTDKGGDIFKFFGDINGGQNQFGGSNNTIMAMTTITADIIREKLKEKGIPEAQITVIEPQITELTAELTKETVDKGKLQEIFLKIKEVGGVFLVSAFAFLSKPEAAEVIHNIMNNVKNLLGG